MSGAEQLELKGRAEDPGRRDNWSSSSGAGWRMLAGGREGAEARGSILWAPAGATQVDPLGMEKRLGWRRTRGTGGSGWRRGHGGSSVVILTENRGKCSKRIVFFCGKLQNLWNHQNRRFWLCLCASSFLESDSRKLDKNLVCLFQILILEGLESENQKLQPKQRPPKASS